MMMFGTFLSTCFAATTPNYYPNKRLLNIDNQIKQLPQEDKDILMYRYIAVCSLDDVAHYIGRSKNYIWRNLERIETQLTLPR